MVFDSLTDVLPQPWCGGTYLLSRAAWILHYCWRAAKSIKFCLYL